jgi:hypothetical protein
MVHLPLIHNKRFKEKFTGVILYQSIQHRPDTLWFYSKMSKDLQTPQTCLMNWKFSMLKTDYCKSEWPQFLLSVEAQSLKFSSSLWNCRVIHMSINRENLGTARVKHLRWSLHRETGTGKTSLHRLGCERKTARWQNESLNQLFSNLPVVDPESYPLCPSNQREYSLYKDKESRHCLKNK